MGKTLGLIHTVASLVPVFHRLVATAMPGIATFNLVDETMLNRTIREGYLTSDIMRRVVEYIGVAELEGADAVLVTCSSIGPAVDASRPFTRTPLLRVDQPMAEKAVSMGTRIGVLATLHSTLDPTADLVRRSASERHKQVEVKARVCEGAFESALAGNVGQHDELVLQGLRNLMAEVDVIVLAQASMARVVDSIRGADLPVPVLSSPQLAVERIATMLDLTQSPRD